MRASGCSFGQALALGASPSALLLSVPPALGLPGIPWTCSSTQPPPAPRATARSTDQGGYVDERVQGGLAIRWSADLGWLLCRRVVLVQKRTELGTPRQE